MQEDSQIPEEVDLTNIVKKSPTVQKETVIPPKQYGIVAVILSSAIILVIMIAIWVMLQPGTPNVPANLPLPGSTPTSTAQPGLNPSK